MKRYVIKEMEMANYLLERDCKIIKIDADRKIKGNVIYIFKDTEDLRALIKKYFRELNNN